MAKIINTSDVPERSAVEMLINMHNNLVADVAAIRAAALANQATVAALGNAIGNTVPTTDTITLRR